MSESGHSLLTHSVPVPINFPYAPKATKMVQRRECTDVPRAMSASTLKADIGQGSSAAALAGCYRTVILRPVPANRPTFAHSRRAA
jgi:hypothetical protein